MKTLGTFSLTLHAFVTVLTLHRHFTAVDDPTNTYLQTNIQAYSFISIELLLLFYLFICVFRLY